MTAGYEFDPQGADVHTDYDGEDVSVVRNGNGRAVMLPRSLTRLSEEAREAAAEVQRTALEISELVAALDEQVAELRAAGGSWSAVGWLVGTTGEAARQRWGQRTEGGE